MPPAGRFLRLPDGAPGAVNSQANSYNPYNPYQTFNDGAANSLPAVTKRTPRGPLQNLRHQAQDNAVTKWVGSNLVKPTLGFVGGHVARPLANSGDAATRWTGANVARPLADAGDSASKWLGTNVGRPLADALGLR